jgi:hypothetical protein
MNKMIFNNRKKRGVFTVGVLLLSSSMLKAQSSWASKVSSASTAGATAISGVMDAVTTLLMAIAAVAFLIGIVNAGFKYKSGDQHAFKNLQGVLMGSLIVLIGVGLAKVLFF